MVALVDQNHSGVRGMLNTSLRSFLTLAVDQRDTAYYDSLAQLRWLTRQYKKLSGVADFERKLDIYASWSREQAHRKQLLDLFFGESKRIGDSERRKLLIRNLLIQYQQLGDSFRIADIAHWRADKYYRLGKADSSLIWALDSYQSSLKLDNRLLAGWSCQILGKVYGNYRGDYQRAEEFLGIGEQMFASVDFTRGLAEIRLERAHQRAGRYETELAQAGFHQALSDFRSIGNRLMEGYCLHALAETAYDKDQLDSARYYAELSLEVRRQLKTRYAAESGHSLSSLGLICAARGDDSSAERYYQQADSVFQHAGSTYGLCLNAARAGGLALNQKNVSEARERFEFVCRNSGLFEETLSSLYGLAVCDYLQGDIESALAKLSRCIKRHESSSLRLRVPEAKAGLLSDRIGFYNLTAVIFARLHSQTDERHFLDSVFHYMERSKAQTLRDMIAATPTSEELGLVEPILDSIARLDNSLLFGSNDSAGVVTEMYKMEDSLERVRFKFGYDRQIPGLASLCEAVDLNTVKENLLKPGDLVLEYLVSEFGCYLLATTTNDIILRELGTSREQLDSNVNAILDNIARYPIVATLPTECADLSQKLYRHLIPTELRGPGRIKRIIVIPDGPLFRMPFDVLISDEGRYLIEDCDVSYTSSLTVLSALSSRELGSPEGNDIVIFADPASDSTFVASLPHSRDEIKMIEDAFETCNIKVYTAEEASKASFRSLDFTSTRYLHISTHGVTIERHAERSALVLANEGGTGSCLMQAAEIATMNIPVDMVVLSACGTASGVSLPGEGVMNLAKPFLVAGARSVVATDWNVDDKGAVRFVKTLYSQLARDGQRLRSFSEAKRDFIHSEIPLYRHPYFWASWRLIGAFK